MLAAAFGPYGEGPVSGRLCRRCKGDFAESGCSTAVQRGIDSDYFCHRIGKSLGSSVLLP